MSDEREEIENTDSADSGAPDLTGALSESEQEFVTEAKAPVNRSTLVLFGIILLAMAGYYFMYLRTGPKAANAASTEVVAADQTIKSFLANGDQSVKGMQEMIKNTEKIVQQFKSYPSTPQIPLENLQTNPFKFLPAAASATSDEANAKRQQVDRFAAMKQAEAMQLQSIVSGTHRACMINNTLYTEGQQCEGFTIEKIETDGVILRIGTLRLRKPMQK